MELESEEFLKRFKKAAEEIETNISEVSGDIQHALSTLGSIIPQLDALEDYSYMSDEILGNVNQIEENISDVSFEVSQNKKRLLALLDHFNIDI